MQSIRNSILSHLRLRVACERQPVTLSRNVLKQLYQQMCASSGTHPDEVVDRVMELVKKFDRINATKVTKTADFQKDLGLDSLDRVELVMAFEEEFSIEIPDEKADNLAVLMSPNI